jgi:hypothetical protein
MIEKSTSSHWAGWGSGLLDLNHARFTSLAGVLQIGKFVPRLLQMEANFAIRTLGDRAMSLSELNRLAAVAPAHAIAARKVSGQPTGSLPCGLDPDGTTDRLAVRDAARVQGSPDRRHPLRQNGAWRRLSETIEPRTES